VIHLAAKTGGVALSRRHPATQYRDSSLIDMNVVEAARLEGANRVVAIGNMFAYGADTPMPLHERMLFDGLPGTSHRGIGLAKRNLAAIAELYRSEFGLSMVVVYSANAYGPGDSLDPQYGHVIPATTMKCLRDTELDVWGDGAVTRDFLYVDDVAKGLVLAAQSTGVTGFLNIGSGHETSIRELVRLIATVSGFTGPIRFDASKAGGDPRRCADIGQARERLGFAPSVDLTTGLAATVAWYRNKLGPTSA
jgi:GDP-L-fucose synthase